MTGKNGHVTAHTVDGGTKERIHSAETWIEHLKARLEELYTKHDALNAGMWKALSVVAGLLVAGGGGFVGALLAPINSNITRLDGEINSLKMDVGSHDQKFVTQFEYKEHLRNQVNADKELLDFKDYVNRDAILRREFETWKGEHDKVRDSLQREIDLIEKRIEAVSGRLNSHEVGDVMQWRSLVPNK